MSTPLFLLRCLQIGLSLSELDLLTIGMVNDMFIESQNDDYDYPALASQDDMDRFQKPGTTGMQAMKVVKLTALISQAPKDMEATGKPGNVPEILAIHVII